MLWQGGYTFETPSILPPGEGTWQPPAIAVAK